jgi:toxin CcdB
MERFNVYPNPLGAGYLLNVQAQMLEHLTSRLAILLLTLKEAPLQRANCTVPSWDQRVSTQS